MQDVFYDKPELVEVFKKSLSTPRFDKYSRAAQGDDKLAIKIYYWNTLLSQSLLLYIQGWEVCLRNKLNDFLIWKYNANWPYEEQRAIRNFKSQDARKLKDARERQEQDRNVQQASIPSIVADLSVGFWVSQLTYDIPYAWRHNLVRVFPNNRELDRKQAWEICDRLSTLRNRIAHHEPIFHLQLQDLRNDLSLIASAMCAATHHYCENNCTFTETLGKSPI